MNIFTGNSKPIWLSIRLPFLILTPACVSLGVGTALTSVSSLNTFNLFLVLAGALSAHISVNMFNEYYDFKSGLDFNTVRTPFSGGSGLLIEQPEAAGGVFKVAILTLVIVLLTGIFFTITTGWKILPIGILGLVLVIGYTNRVTRYPLVCLIAPGLAFGPLMVIGTHLVLAGDFSLQVITVSLIPFFLVNNLLLLNQYPDIEADRQAGRGHFPIAFGKRNSNWIYGLFALLAGFVLVLCVYLDYLPAISLLGLVPIGLAIPVFMAIMKHTDDTEKLMPYLGMNVMVAVLTPLLISGTLISI